MDSKTIAISKSGDVFVFDYPYLDVVYTVTLGSGSWGLYQADGTVVVLDTLTPQIGTDGVTSMPGTFRTSISLAHVSTYSSARVHYDGQGFTLEYTLDNGTSWNTLAEDGVIPLPAHADLDLRVTFPGNIASDPAVVNSITVYITQADVLTSLKGPRSIALGSNAISAGGMSTGTGVVISAATVTGSLDPNGPASTGPVDLTIGSIEMWVTPGTNNVFTGAPGNTTYTNGVVGNPLANTKQHVVVVFGTPQNVALTLAPSMNVTHLALYRQQFTQADVTNLYAAQTGNPKITVIDTSSIAVTESTPATDIYAYAWQIQSGGS